MRERISRERLWWITQSRHVDGTGTQQNLALLTESASSGIVYLAPLTGTVQTGGFGLYILHGGITIDGI